MEQDKIWDYFQNEGPKNRFFPEARQRYMVNQLKIGERVLNIGIGAGGVEQHAIEKEIEIFSLDPSEEAIKRLREKLSMGSRAQVGYAQAIPFDENFFDVVVMSEVLEHLDDSVLKQSLSEVMRVLRPGGFLLASTPYKEDLEASLVVCPDCSKVFHKVGHVQSFEKHSMSAVLYEAEFNIQRLWVTTFIDWKRRGIGKFIKSVLRWLLAIAGQQIADPHLLVKARKPKVSVGL